MLAAVPFLAPLARDCVFGLFGWRVDCECCLPVGETAPVASKIVARGSR